MNRISNPIGSNKKRLTLMQWRGAGYGWYFGFDTLPEPKAGTPEQEAWIAGRDLAIENELSEIKAKGDHP